MYSSILVALCLVLSATAHPSREKRQYAPGEDLSGNPGGPGYGPGGNPSGNLGGAGYGPGGKRPAGQKCTCVPYYQCNGDGNIISDGAGIIDIRVGPNPSGPAELVGGNCPDILEVCCVDPNAPVEPVISTRPPYNPKCGRHYDDQGPLDVRIHLNKSIHHFTNVAQFGAYPWMTAVLLLDPKTNQNVYQCGGSLIDKRVVLTAAHCVDSVNVDYLKVRLGEWDTQQNNDHPYLKHQDVNVADIVLHYAYAGRKNLFNDIALLFLQEEAKLDYHIDTICLPEPGQRYDGMECYATGWGKDQYGIGNWQAILKEIDLPVVPKHECQNRLKDSRLGCGFCLHDTFLCAGGVPGKDTCEGDGGSPLVCYDPQQGNYVQAGIVAWGIGCGSTLPGVYVDVSRYYDWIAYEVNNYLNSNYNYQNTYPGYKQQQAGYYTSPQANNEYSTCLRNLYKPDYNQYKSGHPCQFKNKDGTYQGQNNQYTPSYQGR